MKKIISLLLVLVMMLGLVACGASKPAETQAPTEAPVVTEAPAPETEAPKGGCGSVVWVGALPLLIGAAFVVMKKR